MYYFSAPLPYYFEKVDEFAQVNKMISKSQIKTLFNSLPGELEEFTGFEQARSNGKGEINSLEDFARLIDYTFEKGFDFVYLLNTLQPFDMIHQDELSIKFEKLDKLVNVLKKHGVNKYRISNPQLVRHFKKNYPDIEVYLSTSLNYFTIKQVENAVKTFDNVKEVIPSYEQNRNFTLLSNIRKKLPNLDIELMATEGCIQGCPLRQHHIMERIPYKYLEVDKARSREYIGMNRDCCDKIKTNDFWLYLCTSLVIYPWQLEEYSKIGINKFKFVGRDSFIFGKKGYVDFLRFYLQAVDDESKAEMLPFNIFSSYLWTKNSKILVKDIKPYLPKIEYFKKNGALCASRCGVDCTYCYKCAEKLKNKFGSSW